MTTTQAEVNEVAARATAQVPVWLNLDAFELDPDDVRIIREALAEIGPAVETITEWVERAHDAHGRIAAAMTRTFGGGDVEDVTVIVEKYVGVDDLLGHLAAAVDCHDQFLRLPSQVAPWDPAYEGGDK
jgi:hypothetical protein